MIGPQTCPCLDLDHPHGTVLEGKLSRG